MLLRSVKIYDVICYDIILWVKIIDAVEFVLYIGFGGHRSAGSIAQW